MSSARDKNYSAGGKWEFYICFTLPKASSFFELSRFVLENTGHAGFQVVKVVAVEEPPAGVVGAEFDAHGLARCHVYCVLQRRVLAGALQHAKEMAMQVHRMPHRCLIAQFDLHTVASAYRQRIRLRKDLLVD